MHESAERLADSLLYEGYALYPYTPGATKNATPTPFGIAYPPAYAAAQRAAFDRVQVEVVLAVDDSGDSGEPAIEAASLFLQAAGPRHQASERRVELGPVPLAELLETPIERAFSFEGPAGELTGIVRLAAAETAGGGARLSFSAQNTTPLAPSEVEGMDRAAALARSLLSCQSLLGAAGGRFVSPLENEGALGTAVQACENVNTWPVLASPGDDAVLGAAILLPDHPSIAAESRVNLFDNTEIEEALTLHVQTLSDAEREAIESQDPAVREMIERARATTPEQILALHGEMRPSEPGTLGTAGASPPEPGPEPGPAFPEWSEPGAEPQPPQPPRQGPPPGPADVAGEQELVVDGRAFRRGGKVVLRPGTDGDPYDRMMDGRAATIQRIYLDYDGRAYLGVTIDDDPMAEILDQSGRYLFFFADEVESA